MIISEIQFVLGSRSEDPSSLAMDNANWAIDEIVKKTDVRVGESCFFSVNSSYRENIEIAEGSVIGAGTTVLRSTKPHQLLIAPEPTSLQLKQGHEDFLIRPAKQAD